MCVGYILVLVTKLHLPCKCALDQSVIVNKVVEYHLIRINRSLPNIYQWEWIEMSRQQKRDRVTITRLWVFTRRYVVVVVVGIVVVTRLYSTQVLQKSRPNKGPYTRRCFTFLSKSSSSAFGLRHTFLQTILSRYVRHALEPQFKWEECLVRSLLHSLLLDRYVVYAAGNPPFLLAVFQLGRVRGGFLGLQ